MTQSMTGFARSSVSTSRGAVIVELRSVNNRYLDTFFRCPDNLRPLEPQLRQSIAKAISRGKVEASIRVNAENTQDLVISQTQLQALKTALVTIADEFPDNPRPDHLALLLAPGILGADSSGDDELQPATLEAMALAVADLVSQRTIEGDKLKDIVLVRLNAMDDLLAQLRAQLPALRQQQRQRIIDKLSSAGIETDQSRLEEELVYAAQRADVDEEMDRLAAHMSAIRAALDGSQPCGRRLDFLMQELNREANTLSSKSTALEMTNTAVEFKVLIEQMREQIQNIE